SDSVEAEKATLALALYDGPAYLRVARDKSPVLSTEKTPFALNKANILRDGKDVSIVACGVMVYNALIAAEALAKEGIEAEVINAAVVKP
ncbi:transketolase C-terminal domain-containing protein, partial [Enterococcus faecium]|uniref:transketolase C-terminal domain-containing protein n=1 Tax=Enterococcus faecium TaxID=1352 RepID=UPI003F41FD2E